MGDFTLAHRRYVNSGRRIGIINDKAYAANKVYVIQSYHNNGFATIDRMPSHNNNNNHFNRKKRVAKYKLYSMEGKVKTSFKNGYRWFKNTCSRFIHGF
ncbi:unnamed protein product [Withania somnifera]